MTWDRVGDWAFVAFSATAILFVLLYLVLSPWWKREAGRNIMAMMATLAIIGAYGSYTMLTDRRPPAFYQIRFSLFFLMAVIVGWRVIIFIKEQIIVRKDRKEGQNA